MQPDADWPRKANRSFKLAFRKINDIVPNGAFQLDRMMKNLRFEGFYAANAIPQLATKLEGERELNR